MKVLVTGGTGTVGREAVKRLVAHGHDVLVVGRRQEMSIDGASYRSCDISDFVAIREVVRGRDGIVHLAAIANPSLAPGQEIFRVNASGTYNVYEAAAQEGIKRIVSASSINAFGYFFGVKSFPLRYFPVDEEHETYTSDPYSFSKQIIEEIGHYYWRREGISSVALRLPGVYELKGPTRFWITAHRDEMVSRLQQLVDMPEEERRPRVQEMIAQYNKVIRQGRFFEKPQDESIIDTMINQLDVWMMVQRDNFWTSVDARDSAQVIEQGLTVDYTGSHVLFINDDRNDMGMNAKDLTEVFFPGVPWKHEPEGDECLVSIRKAQELLGFRPEYHGLQDETE